MSRAPRSGTYDQAELSARVYAGVIGVVSIPIGGLVAFLVGLRGSLHVPVALATGVGVMIFVHRVAIGIARGSGKGMLAFVQPSGNSSPYERDFSRGLALEAADDIAAAMAWFDGELLAHPQDARLRAAFADLHMRQGRHARAESLYLETRRLTSARDLELYCTQRVIELRLGPLNEPSRAFPELRRVIDRFPGSREAEGARAALVRIKAEALAAARD